MENKEKSYVDLGNRIAISMEDMSENGYFFLKVLGSEI
jgi:hypothetical protein